MICLSTLLVASTSKVMFSNPTQGVWMCGCQMLEILRMGEGVGGWWIKISLNYLPIKTFYTFIYQSLNHELLNCKIISSMYKQHIHIHYQPWIMIIRKHITRDKHMSTLTLWWKHFWEKSHPTIDHLLLIISEKLFFVHDSLVTTSVQAPTCNAHEPPPTPRHYMMEATTSSTM